MRLPSLIGLFAFALGAAPTLAVAQSAERLNPMISLHERGLPVFGITHPAITIRRGRHGGPGGQPSEPTPTEEPSLFDAARATVAYKMSDYEYNRWSPQSAERFMGYIAALMAAGASMKEHAFVSKIPTVHDDLELARARVIEQLNAGHAGIIMQEVETAEEVRQAISAMRLPLAAQPGR